MTKYLFVLLFLILSCTTPLSQKYDSDIIDNLIFVHKINSLEALLGTFGEPLEAYEEGEFKTYVFKDFSTTVDPQNKILIGTSLKFWKDFDVYVFLKKKFQNFKWEEKLLDNNSSHVVQENYEVKIPQAGIKFQYDNQDPLRRPTHIFFKSVK